MFLRREYRQDGGLRSGRRENRKIAGSALLTLVQIYVQRAGPAHDPAKDQGTRPHGGASHMLKQIICTINYQKGDDEKLTV